MYVISTGWGHLAFPCRTPSGHNTPQMHPQNPDPKYRHAMVETRRKNESSATMVNERDHT